MDLSIHSRTGRWPVHQPTTIYNSIRSRILARPLRTAHSPFSRFAPPRDFPPTICAPARFPAHHPRTRAFSTSPFAHPRETMPPIPAPARFCALNPRTRARPLRWARFPSSRFAPPAHERPQGRSVSPKPPPWIVTEWQQVGDLRSIVERAARALATFASRKLLALLVGQPDAFGAGESARSNRILQFH